MRYLLLLSVLLTGCTIYHGGVKNVDVYIKNGEPVQVALEKCDLKVYLALYGLVASEENCRTEHGGVHQAK